MEKHSVSRMLGAPPGYVGFEEGGQLTEAVRRRPYCVLLFDEIEKAHPDVFNVLLQILDDGRVTDSQGRTIDFKNTAIIMTSNIALTSCSRGVAADGQLTEEARESTMGELRRHFRPEFLNRVDEIVLFKPLTPGEIESIVELLMADLESRLADRQVTISLSPRRGASSPIVDSIPFTGRDRFVAISSASWKREWLVRSCRVMSVAEPESRSACATASSRCRSEPPAAARG